MNITITNGSDRVVLTDHPFALSKEVNLSGLSANITTVDTNRDGSQYIKSLFSNRDVSFEGFIRTYGMEEKTIQSYRDKLYRIWNPKKKVTIEFESEEDYYQIEGYPISFPVFQTGFENKNNRFHRFLLDMTSTNPYLFRKKKTITFASVQPLFSFPMTFNSVSFGERSDTLIQTVVNDGIMECPLEIRMKANGIIENPYLLNIYSGEKILFNTTLQNGEEIYLSTGQVKEVSKIANGVKENFYYALDLDSDFIQLNVGDNIFRFGADSNEELMVVEISYKERLGGV